MPPGAAPAEPVHPAIRQQALAWYSLTLSGDITAEQLQQLERWRQADSEHERAWQRMAGLPELIHSNAALLRDPLARAALQQTRYVSGDRRQLLKLLAGVSVLGAVGWQGRDSQWLQGSLADLRTATGERRREVLADGTQLWLNTATAVDIAFTAGERRISLRYGEINVLTAADSARRPLLVQTTDADLRPLGTRFTVRCGDGCVGTRVSVSSGRVAARLRQGPAAHVVEAGQQALLEPGSLSVDPRAPLDDAWVDGLVIAQATRLGELVTQLARYRPGILRCDPRIADLRVTGSYPLTDNERILALLEGSLPLSIQRRTRYWVTLVPRSMG
ncbi:Protein FecR [Pseudomonas reidholzensis]|uniref:Protein FecR n=1 Tax=Pseudomonas reidholzensis TaxID=1785162 RepID=A0A383RPP1_9PSED|nr:FecR domain-containing protein [Pseudomonas reidholzensis]SYX89002.1 Protein FecR [Pseudomonas reidholzensis]